MHLDLKIWNGKIDVFSLEKGHNHNKKAHISEYNFNFVRPFHLLVKNQTERYCGYHSIHNEPSKANTVEGKV
jgi:hypothetical protein